MPLTTVQKKVLEILYVDRIIGGRHTHAERVIRGFPKHLRGEARDALDELVRRGFVRKKPTRYGLQVSLNPEVISEVKQILGF